MFATERHGPVPLPTITTRAEELRTLAEMQTETIADLRRRLEAVCADRERLLHSLRESNRRLLRADARGELLEAAGDLVYAEGGKHQTRGCPDEDNCPWCAWTRKWDENC